MDLREVDSTSRHAALRMVPQDGFLFDTTLGRNVAYGRVGATPEEVEGAFTELGLGGWLAALPWGLDTRVGERGENLSVSTTVGNTSTRGAPPLRARSAR